MGSSFDRCAFIGLACCALVAAACNRTEGECYPRGEGGAAGPGGPGAGGGPIVPGGPGGNGDVPPEPQGAGDGTEGADPCNAVEGNIYTCSGVVNCHKGDDLDQCPFWNRKQSAVAAGAAIEALVVECQSTREGYSCSQGTLTCNGGSSPPVKPQAARYVCNGGVTCTDSKGHSDGCTYVAEEVWADDAQDATDLLVEICEDEKHDSTGNNCDHGGYCCSQGSLTCNKAN